MTSTSSTTSRLHAKFYSAEEFGEVFYHFHIQQKIQLVDRDYNVYQIDTLQSPSTTASPKVVLRGEESHDFTVLECSDIRISELFEFLGYVNPYVGMMWSAVDERIDMDQFMLRKVSEIPTCQLLVV